MKSIPFFIILMSTVLLLPSCKEKDDPMTVVGTWEVITHTIEQIQNDEVINDVTYHETGVYSFNGDGTGFVKLDVAVLGVPLDNDILWEADSLGRIRIDYQDGQPVRRFDPSYRGDFLLLTGSFVTGSIGNIVFTNTEIFFRRQ